MITKGNNNNGVRASAKCPRCAQPMQLTRVTIRFGALTDILMFECAECGTAHIEERGPQGAISPATRPGGWYLDEFGNPTREIKAAE
jgi:hypothetical protein